jgi:hypothetical protein
MAISNEVASSLIKDAEASRGITPVDYNNMKNELLFAHAGTMFFENLYALRTYHVFTGSNKYSKKRTKIGQHIIPEGSFEPGLRCDYSDGFMRSMLKSIAAQRVPEKRVIEVSFGQGWLRTYHSSGSLIADDGTVRNLSVFIHPEDQQIVEDIKLRNQEHLTHTKTHPRPVFVNAVKITTGLPEFVVRVPGRTLENDEFFGIKLSLLSRVLFRFLPEEPASS